MFIKKDLRKIDEILGDANDTRERVLLPKRSSELRGSVKVLCKESNIKKLANLKVLNLYENELTSLKGIGILASTPVEDINLGFNQLSNIPLEFGTLSTIKTLWLDDNQIDTFPICLCSIPGLEVLRLTGNRITHIPQSVAVLVNIITLAVDNNNISEFPTGILHLPKLEHLWLRQNKLTVLPENLDELSKLKTLSVSSNLLEALPDCLSGMHTLINIYANGNNLSTINADLCLLPNLKELNLANNRLTVLPETWREMWGPMDVKTQSFGGGINGNKDGKCCITVTSNPFFQSNGFADADGVVENDANL